MYMWHVSKSSVIYGNETCVMKADQLSRLEWTEMHMVTWMCGKSLSKRKTDDEV